MSTGGRVWLIVGHGSVGSALVQRVTAHSDRALVFDPVPRIPIALGESVSTLDGVLTNVGFVASCVPPENAEDAARMVASGIPHDALFLEWNTVRPTVKRRVADIVPCNVVDVALLDTFDSDVSTPRIALSGSAAAEARDVLAEYGFTVELAGEEVGAAARLKYLRSIFMKSLEALVLEHAALTTQSDDAEIVLRSIESNLGTQFMEFARVLIKTNRLHAVRRARELDAAIATFADEGSSLAVARGAGEVLRRAAAVWNETSAPPPGSDAETLAKYLARLL